MSSFLELQRQIASTDLCNSAGELAKTRLPKERFAFAEKTRAAYLEALEISKQTGQVPEIFQDQDSVPEDKYIAEKALMYVLLRELHKVDPTNPLVIREEARQMLRQGALIKFCRSGYSKNVFRWPDIVPSVTETERIKNQF